MSHMSLNAHELASLRPAPITLEPSQRIHADRLGPLAAAAFRYRSQSQAAFHATGALSQYRSKGV